ncbi:LysR family transcriptional regulator [Rhizobium leguminosarum]|uniref:LysR family transcriptional regulator n=1 Tax=Rhizobium leguminosarum TaxID=384 RepID=UPI003F98B070
MGPTLHFSVQRKEWGGQIVDELGNIKTFIDVVECGSFSAAARRKDTTVSSVARQVKALEDELGVRLLNRTTRSNSLTEPGANFYERARTVVTELRSAKQEASSFQTTVKGLLRVCLRISASRVILPALPVFLERHPDLVLDVMLSDERLDLVAHKIDVGVWLGHLEDSRIVARRLTPSKRVICASPAYLAKRGVPSTPQEITQHNCIIYQGSIYQDLWRFTKGDEQIDVTVHGNLRTNTSPVLVAAVLSGMGLAVLQEFTVRSALADGTLKQILPEYEVSPTDVDTGVYAVYPNARGMTRKTRVFIDFLVDLFRRP